MSRSKKTFLALSAVFLIIMIIIGIDISKKTTFPGSKKYLKESLSPSDSLESDSSKEKSH